jgi:Leucine-rich repeat (LRR) protein
MKNIFTLSLKKVLIGLVFLSGTFVANSQNVNIPDPIFKAALTSNLAINTNADGEIQVSEAVAYGGTIDIQFLGISNLTGIEEFTELTGLLCDNNLLSNLELSSNTQLQVLTCSFNDLTSINLPVTNSLTQVFCGNNLLSTLNISSNLNLTDLYCEFNQLSIIDASMNNALIYLNCNDNNLSTLNIKNGNNTNLMDFNATNNPSLTCIQVDDPIYMNTIWSAGKDAGAIFSTCCSGGNVTIPDPNFKAALVNDDLVDTNFDDEIQCSEAAAYTGGFDIQSLSINDLTGIETFVNITYLYCDYNNITTLDLTNNTALESFSCSNNTGLSTLNVSNNTALTYLSCGATSLTDIDVSNNTSLYYLACFYNANLGTLDVSQNVALEHLDCMNCSLGSLDVSSNIVLVDLYCNNNSLSNLNLQNGNNSNLFDFNATSNPALSCIQVDNPSFMDANFSAGKDAGASFNTSCPIVCNVIVNIPDANFKNALLAIPGLDANLDLEIQCTEAASFLGPIDVSFQNIADLTGIEAFTNITELYCQGNQLTNVDFSQNTALTILYCFDNQLSTLDISSNINLFEFGCGNNFISFLDVSNNINLISLSCIYNSLTSLNLNTNVNIQSLYCFYNQITNLDLSNNTSLNTLYCDFNALSYLNIQNGNNNNLFGFDATNNPLLTCIQVDSPGFMDTNFSGSKDAGATYNTFCDCIVNIPDANFKAALVGNDFIDTNFDDEIQCSEAAAYSGLIDVSYQGISDLTGIEAFSSLTDLDCSGNSIASLNLSGNTSLSWLQCIANNMTSINVTNCPNLSFFNCGNNLITTIDVSNNPLIQQLWAFGNQLTNLDLSNNNNILSLELNDNQLTNIDVSNLLNLNDFRCANNNITTLDLSNNTLLSTIVVFNNSALTSLNLKNIDVFAIGFLNATGNTNLGCVSVDDVANFNANWSAAIDGITTYNFNCDAFVNIPDGVFKTALTTNSVINPNLDGEITFGEAANYTGSITVNNLGVSDLTGIEAFVNIVYLNCSNNTLSNLDLTSNSKLQNVNCSFNNLTTFATPLTNVFTDLNCSNNQISSIFLDDVSGLGKF